MTSNDLPNDDHVVRYTKPTHLRKVDGRPTGAAFCLRSDETGLSVNWLECFRDLSKNEQLAEVRRLYRLDMSKNGQLAELNVGKTKHYLRNELYELRFIKKPLVAEGDYEADPSHSEITGLPRDNSPEAELVGDMIAQTVTGVHPTVLIQPNDV